jgi:uncharacterized protein (TIGR02118 family)
VFKVMFVVHEKAGRDRAASLEYWRTTHGDVVRKVPGVVSYVQHHAVAAPDGTLPFLGVATLSFEDEAAFGVAAASQEFAAAIADVANFADETRLPTAFVEDVVIV